MGPATKVGSSTSDVFSWPLTGSSIGIASREDGSERVNFSEDAAMKELRSLLASAHRERDDLLKDVEALCMQVGAWLQIRPHEPTTLAEWVWSRIAGEWL